MDDIKDVMISNIDKILQRGEKLELVIDKTADLADAATVCYLTNDRSLVVVPKRCYPSQTSYTLRELEALHDHCCHYHHYYFSVNHSYSFEHEERFNCLLQEPNINESTPKKHHQSNLFSTNNPNKTLIYNVPFSFSSL